jgi:hypothetical protein
MVRRQGKRKIRALIESEGDKKKNEGRKEAGGSSEDLAGLGVHDPEQGEGSR